MLETRFFFIFPHCSCHFVQPKVYAGKLPLAGKEYGAEYCLKDLQESIMDRCTGHCYITEILLETLLNTINQSINHEHGSCSDKMGGLIHFRIKPPILVLLTLYFICQLYALPIQNQIKIW